MYQISLDNKWTENLTLISHWMLNIIKEVYPRDLVSDQAGSLCTRLAFAVSQPVSSHFYLFTPASSIRLATRQIGSQ